mmetsp:Transcript_21409/g.50968  ORF Transcript_21409/g.50968 Transcript_21409/m.50968 type:complete len:214 (-) Transcript_21409:219-860(-)
MGNVEEEALAPKAGIHFASRSDVVTGCDRSVSNRCTRGVGRGRSGTGDLPRRCRVCRGWRSMRTRVRPSHFEALAVDVVAHEPSGIGGDRRGDPRGVSFHAPSKVVEVQGRLVAPTHLVARIRDDGFRIGSVSPLVGDPKRRVVVGARFQPKALRPAHAQVQEDDPPTPRRRRRRRRWRTTWTTSSTRSTRPWPRPPSRPPPSRPSPMVRHRP